MREDAGAGDRQRELYGESWSVRLHRLMGSYQMSQARLAAVVGLSAPMVSQLMSGQRVKISNPAVYGRIVRLEELAGLPGVLAGDPDVRDRVLSEVAASHPVLSTREVPAPAVDRGAVLAALAAQASIAGLLAASRAAAEAGDAALASLLSAAAGGERGR